MYLSIRSQTPAVKTSENHPAPIYFFGLNIYFCFNMPKPLDPQTKKHLAARVKYYKEMGIHDFYRQPVEPSVELALQPVAETTPEKDPKFRRRCRL